MAYQPLDLCMLCRVPREICKCNKKTTDQKYKESQEKKIKSSGGGSANYYDLPPNAEQLLDLIEFRNMNGNIKDIFKACYRLGQKEGTSEIYDVQKMVLYSIRELGRLTPVVRSASRLAFLIIS